MYNGIKIKDLLIMSWPYFWMTFSKKNKQKREKKHESAITQSVLFNELTFIVTLHLLFPLLNKYIQIYVKTIWYLVFQPIVSSQGLFFPPFCCNCLGLGEFSVDMGADVCFRGLWVNVCLSGPKKKEYI